MIELCGVNCQYIAPELKGLIGIAGKAYSGKTTTARIIKQELQSVGERVLILPFAAPLKNLAARTLDIDVKMFSDPNVKETLRPFITWFGTEFGQNPLFGYYKERWIDEWICAFEQNEWYDQPYTYTIFDDLRFPHEREFIDRQNGNNFIVHVDSPDKSRTSSVDGHISEKRLEVKYNDWCIINKQSDGLEQYQLDVRIMLGRMGLLG